MNSKILKYQEAISRNDIKIATAKETIKKLTEENEKLSKKADDLKASMLMSAVQKSGRNLEDVISMIIGNEDSLSDIDSIEYRSCSDYDTFDEKGEK